MERIGKSKREGERIKEGKDLKNEGEGMKNERGKYL